MVITVLRQIIDKYEFCRNRAALCLCFVFSLGCPLSICDLICVSESSGQTEPRGEKLSHLLCFADRGK